MLLLVRGGSALMAMPRRQPSSMASVHRLKSNPLADRSMRTLSISVILMRVSADLGFSERRGGERGEEAG